MANGCQRPLLQFIPARGRKQNTNTPAVIPGMLQFIPARGRKQLVVFCPCGKPCVAIYPREGTETCPFFRSPHGRRVAIYPREGTETSMDRFALIMVDCCNLSPRGDGNFPDHHRWRRCKPLQFIPARGRKHATAGIWWIGNGCNLSPRGDGNNRRRIAGLTQERCNLSPRGDGNPIQLVYLFTVDSCNLSPRGDGNRCVPTP